MDDNGDIKMGLDDRIKELVAVGASITANCQPCLEYHSSKAKEAGANEEEIKEAIAVGKMVRKGSAMKMDKFIVEFVKDTTKASDDTDCI